MVPQYSNASKKDSTAELFLFSSVRTFKLNIPVLKYIVLKVVKVKWLEPTFK